MAALYRCNARLAEAMTQAGEKSCASGNMSINAKPRAWQELLRRKLVSMGSRRLLQSSESVILIRDTRNAKRWRAQANLSSETVALEEQPQQQEEQEEAWVAPKEFSDAALVKNQEEYAAMYRRSVEDPDGFWSEIASGFVWQQKWAVGERGEVHSENLDIRKGPVEIKWFQGGTTNICFNALDAQLAKGLKDKTAILWEGNEPGSELRLTYRQVAEAVCELANYLRRIGVRKGDFVTLYMPMLPELPIAMLACARIGAVHSVVFGGFSAEALAQRIDDCGSRVVLTASGTMRGKKLVALKQTVDDAIERCQVAEVSSVLVLENPSALTRENTPWVDGRDVSWKKAIEEERNISGPAAAAGESLAEYSPVEWVDAEDPLFLLYTSGSTGRPKGVLHTTGGYMVYAATTFRYAFDVKVDDVYWCTADCGWITGHSYVAYGPFLNGATQVIFEGVPNYPNWGRWWQIVDKFKVSVFYTAPTAIRAAMGAGSSFAAQADLSSLRVLGSVGEPINPAAWKWYHEAIGKGKCPISDTWWQTETGGFMITPLPGAWPQKPGSASLPFFGVQPAMVDEKGIEIEGEGSGYLCMKASWPSAFRTLYGDHARYEATYFAPFKGFYFSGDGCRRDKDGYYWLTGRVDDVINVSGHRIGTAEVESALVAHPSCAEAAVVGYDHDIKGQGIYAFVTIVEGVEYSDELRRALVNIVRGEIGPFAAPDKIHWAPGLPKTRSGKIMRRILRKIAGNQVDELGDISTLADPGIVERLLELRGK